MRWLRLALVACAGLYLKDASRLPEALEVNAELERWPGSAQLRSGPGSPDPLQDFELLAVIVVALLLTLFFERAYRNLRVLPAGAGVLWRGTGRRWRRLVGCWAGLTAVATASIAAGNRLHAEGRSIDQSQFRQPIEAAGELVTVAAAVVTAVIVSVVAFRQSRQAAELGLAG